MSWTDSNIIAGAFVIIGAIIGGAVGSYAIYWLTHRPKVIAQKTKLEVRQKMQAENALEVLRALGKFYLEVSDMESQIETLSEVIIIRYNDEMTLVTGRKKLDETIHNLNLTNDIREMLKIANNTIVENCKLFIEITNYLTALFQMDEIISEKTDISEKMTQRVLHISSTVNLAFNPDENLSNEDIIKQVKAAAEKHGGKAMRNYENRKQTEFEAEIEQLTREIKNIYKERLI